MSAQVCLDGRSLKIFDVVHVARDDHEVAIDDAVWAAIIEGRAVVDRVLAERGQAYGVTTGVGSQKDSPVTESEAQEFNRRLLLAHATVATDLRLNPIDVKAGMLVQLNLLLGGRTGVRPELVRALLEQLQGGQIPPVSAGASVGASDLVPLAQIALPVVGGHNPLGSTCTVPSVTLAAKEALSLMNSNAVSLGQGALVLLHARKLLRGFDLTACFALEGFRGNLSILDPAVLAAHPMAGQAIATAHMQRLLGGSALWQPEEARNIQDPLSFRCAPQIHGASYSALEWVWHNWELELNMVQDNPVVDLVQRKLVSHGNMDTTLLTLGMDTLRSGLAAVVDVSAQRLHKLHWPAFSGLPTGLAHGSSPLGGVQFLNLSHIAEAYASTVRARARPALLNYQGQLADGVEDYATLLPLSISETHALIEAAQVVQALELIVAAWAIQRRGVSVERIGAGLRAVYDKIEPLLPIGREGDAVFDVRPIVELVANEEIVDLIDDAAPPVPAFESPPKYRLP